MLIFKENLFKENLPKKYFGNTFLSLNPILFEKPLKSKIL